MSPEHENHLDEIKMDACERCDDKYRAGQAEHGGDLWRKSGMLKMAQDESIDLITYLPTLRRQLEHIEALIETQNYADALLWIKAILDDKTEQIVYLDKPETIV